MGFSYYKDQGNNLNKVFYRPWDSRVKTVAPYDNYGPNREYTAGEFGHAIDKRDEVTKRLDQLEGERWFASQREPEPTGAAFHSYEEVLNAPPVEFAIRDFLQEDAITLFGGPPAAMKTYCALSVAKSLLSEELLFDCFQVEEKAKQVIYLSPESALGPFADRLKKLNLLPYVLDGSFLFSTISAVEPIRDLRDSRLVSKIQGADVFLDTVVRFAEGDENSAEAQRVFADNLFSLLKLGARTITGLHHAPKSFGGANVMNLENVLRGSGDIGAMAATVWGFSKINEEKSQIYVKNVKDRDFREAPKPFVIEARPHLDEQGKFKLLHAPGNAEDYSHYKQSERGKKGAQARKKNLTSAELKAVVADLAKGRTQEAVARDVGISARTLARMLDAQFVGWEKFAGSAAESAVGGKPPA